MKRTIGTLPGVETSLADPASKLALGARPLLSASRGVLMTLTAPTSPRGAPITTMYWNGSGALLPLPAWMLSDDVSRRSLTRFEQAGRLVLDQLVRRWPANALPPAIGVVTDGTGVGFSSDHPSPMWPDWLTLHLTGTCPTTSLLPFSPAGTWARLTAPDVDRRLH
ncbi:hypothetical protein U1839_06935 [Sphingomonas sp. RT2P30]|uniref:hypothetical protein n=1 Tax=Parasphingomonas halimpatiens TaxID=3096162 RepID=UPI002FC83A88